MAATVKNRRTYMLPDADLMQLGDSAVHLIDRDTAELALYGIDAALRTLIVDKTEEFKDFPTDEELEGDVSVKTEQKNKILDEVLMGIRSIMIRVRNAFGLHSDLYGRFGTRNVNRVSDIKLYRVCKRVIKLATDYLAELQPQGLTQAIIDELETKNEALDKAIDEKDTAMINRDIATKQRVRLGNELYQTIVRTFNAGRDYWGSRSEAKYNDYIIYGSPKKKKI